jgi:hypothetical protein
LGIPNHPGEIEYRVDTDPTLNGRGFEGRDLENSQVQALRQLGIGSNVEDDWDCPHSAHLSVVDKAQHTLRATAPGPRPAKRWQG